MVFFRFCFVFLMLVSLTACQGTGHKSGQEYVEELLPIGQGSKGLQRDKKKESSQNSQKNQDKVSSNTHPPNCDCQQNASTASSQPPPLENFDELPPPKKLLVNPLGDRAPLKRKPQELLIMSLLSNFGWS